jgi:glutaredoxin
MTKFVLYAQVGCKSSDITRKYLVSESVEFIEYDITYDVIRKSEMIQRTGGRKHTPQIFYNNSHIKTLEDLCKLINELKAQNRVA